MTGDRVLDFLVNLGQRALVAPPASTADPAVMAHLRTGAQRFVSALEAAIRVDAPPSSTRAADTILKTTSPAHNDLAKQLRDVTPLLPWGPARQDPLGDERSIADLANIVDLGNVIAGLMVVAPGADYPVHHHAPQEFYLVVDGTADWRFGGAEEWSAVEPGEVFYNPPDVWHGQRNGPQPCVSLYVLWEDAEDST